MRGSFGGPFFFGPWRMAQSILAYARAKSPF